MSLVPDEKTTQGIYWTHSRTLVEGCEPVSPACLHCWAARFTARRDTEKRYVKNGAWTGCVRVNNIALEKLEQRRASAMSRRKLKPQVVQIWNDFFYFGTQTVESNALYEAWQCMEMCPDTFLILTKRPEHIRGFMSCYEIGFQFRLQPTNIILGTTVESQDHVQRIDRLCEGWRFKKFLSLEPLLGAINLEPYLQHIDQVIIGCESGSGRRQPPPLNILLDIIAQCEAAKVPVFLKQYDFGYGLVKLPEIDGKRYNQLLWNKQKGDTE